MTGYRTLIFNFIAALLPLLEMTEMTAMVPPEYLNYYIIAVALANVGLRVITTTPVGRSS